MFRKLSLVLLLSVTVGLVLLAIPTTARACPMCKEAVEGNSAVANSYGWSVLLMAGAPFALIAVIAGQALRSLNPAAYEETKGRAASFFRRRGWIYGSAGLLLLLVATYVITPQANSMNLRAARPALAQVRIPPSALVGKVVVVTFFASWCEPCRDQVADLGKFRGEFPSDELTLVAVNAFEDYKVPHTHADGTVHYHDPAGSPADLPAFLATVGPGLYILPVTPEISAAFGGVTRIPTTFVFDRDGRLAERYVNDLTGDFMKPEADVLRQDIQQAAACGQYSWSLLRAVCLKWN